MRKRFTKIICAAFGVISAATMVCASACSANFGGVDEKDAYSAKVSSNGGFVVETGEGNDGYVYFVNGRAGNTDSNVFGSVVKGSVQRIKKSDVKNGNYSSTQTVVPSVVYSGNYNAGIYIYGDYIYYTSPSTQRDTDGNVLNTKLDFKRTSLDGKNTTQGYLWQSSDNAVDYRYVKVGDTVYIIYALSENLYGSSATNIHAVNCETKENVLLAYNVNDYAFDTENPENPYIYYTMDPKYKGSADSKAYSQLFRVRADVTESPRTIDFSEVEDYDAEKDPLYVNYGDFVFDGIGIIDNESGRYGQYNFGYGTGKTFTVHSDDYTYTIEGYKNGELLYTRTGGSTGSLKSLFTIKDSTVDADGNGRVDESWNAIENNDTQKPFIYGYDDTDYVYYQMTDKTDGTVKNYAISISGGITKAVVNSEGKVETALTISSVGGSKVMGIKVEEGHHNLYYLASGGNGYSLNRIAIDGDEDDYRKLSTGVGAERSLVYRSVKVLDVDMCSDWFLPEFVGNTLLFASEVTGMSDYNYIMACDLTGTDGKIMTNNQIDAYNKQFEAVTDKISAYDDVKNADDTAAYENLSAALKYLYYTKDAEYLGELKTAYVEIDKKAEDYIFTAESVEIYGKFLTVEGEWKSWKNGSDDVDFVSKKIDGKDVYSNTRDYYYAVIGKISEEDAKSILEGYRTAEGMPEYPVDESTWWDKLSTGGRVGFIIGMVAAGLAVIGGVTVLTVFLVKRRKRRLEENGGKKRMEVDITDDKEEYNYDE